MKLEGDGSRGTLIQRMVLECSPSTQPVRPGLSITLQGSDDDTVQNRSWILLLPDQAKQLASYLQSLYP